MPNIFFEQPPVYIVISLAAISLFSLYLAWKVFNLYLKSHDILKMYSQDLVQLAREGGLDPVINREDEIRRIIQILARRGKNNPLLIGEAGVGKTAIAEGIAQRIVKKEVPDTLLNKRVISLDIVALVSGTKYRGEFEERLSHIEQIVSGSERNIILFIDEVHVLSSAGEAEGGIAAADILKPALARGTLQLVGTTTFEGFEVIKKDQSLMRRLQPVIIKEMGLGDSFKILRGLKQVYEKHHGIIITDEALRAAVELSVKYLPQRHLPDKAIDLLDEAASKIKLEAMYSEAKQKPHLRPEDVARMAREWYEVLTR